MDERYWSRKCPVTRSWVNAYAVCVVCQSRKMGEYSPPPCRLAQGGET